MVFFFCPVLFHRLHNIEGKKSEVYVLGRERKKKLCKNEAEWGGRTEKGLRNGKVKFETGHDGVRDSELFN